MAKTSDVLIVGGGAIGLTSALELAQAGLSVRLLERQSLGKESSWAGAGMIPPGDIETGSEEYEQLSHESSLLWPEKSQMLLELTGIDNEYRQFGSLLFSTDDDDAVLESEVARWQSQSISAEHWNHSKLHSTEWNLADSIKSACYLPDAAQVRNPLQLKALEAACRKLGVQIHEHTKVEEWKQSEERIEGVVTENEEFEADQYVLATGAWSGKWSESLGFDIPVGPLRGQIVLLKGSTPMLKTLEQGKRYLVPRIDGRIIIGSTEQDVGFDRSDDQEAIESLVQFAYQLVPELANTPVEKSWCGFRPVAIDKLPILGKTDYLTNLVVATGHYRAGLSLSPITGVVIKEIILGKSHRSLEGFSPMRFQENAPILGQL